MGISPNGLLVAHCGVTYVGNDDMERRPSSEMPPVDDLCEACHVAFRRSAR